ncbi:MAG: CARDB domain-containing protein [Kiloniellaceae bacterium]
MAKRPSPSPMATAGPTTALSIAVSIALSIAGGAGQAAAQPDLVAQLNNPMNASVGVQNIGDSDAGPSHLTLNCTRFGQADGGCPDIPGLAAYMNPAFPNRVVVNVPALAAGQSFNHNLAFWNAIAWPAGTFIFDAEIDPGNAIAEANEANNATQSSHTQQPGVGVAPKPPLPLKAAGAPAQPRPKPALRPMLKAPALKVRPTEPTQPQRLLLHPTN